MVKDALFSATCWFDCDALRLHTVLGALWLVLFPSARTCSLERSPRYALRSRARAEGKIPAPSSRPPVRNAGSGTDHKPASGGLQRFVSDSPQAVGYHVCRLPRWVAGSPGEVPGPCLAGAPHFPGASHSLLPSVPDFGLRHPKHQPSATGSKQESIRHDRTTGNEIFIRDRGARSHWSRRHRGVWGIFGT